MEIKRVKGSYDRVLDANEQVQETLTAAEYRITENGNVVGSATVHSRGIQLNLHNFESLEDAEEYLKSIVK